VQPMELHPWRHVTELRFQPRHWRQILICRI
jgi:hypothetical protein